MSEAAAIVEQLDTSSCVAVENGDSCDPTPSKRRRYSSPPAEQKACSKSPLSPPPPPQYCDKNAKARELDAASVLCEINTGRSILNGAVVDVSNTLKRKLQEFVADAQHAAADDDTTNININVASSPSYPRFPKFFLSPGGIDDEVDIDMPYFPSPINLPIRTGPRPANHASGMHVSSLPVVRFAEQVEQDRPEQRAALAPRSRLSISLSPRLSQRCQEEHAFVPIQLEDELVDEEECDQTQDEEVIQILL